MGRFSGATPTLTGVFNGFTLPSFDPFFTAVFVVISFSLALIFALLGDA
jgi:hypothetical protein